MRPRCWRYSAAISLPSDERVVIIIMMILLIINMVFIIHPPSTITPIATPNHLQFNKFEIVFAAVILHLPVQFSSICIIAFNPLARQNNRLFSLWDWRMMEVALRAVTTTWELGEE